MRCFCASATTRGGSPAGDSKGRNNVIFRFIFLDKIISIAMLPGCAKYVVYKLWIGCCA